jgi:hypothetical protein
MLLSLLLAPLAQLAPAPAVDSLLATVPDDAYLLVHCRDLAALRARAERNDWYRLLGTSHGAPLLEGFARELRAQTHSELDELLAMARALEGEVVFFDTGTVAGFVTEPPASRAALVELVRAWLPEGDAAARRTLEIAGGSVELVAWPDELDGWTGRAGHFAAFVDHPRALSIYSGDDSAAVLTALTAGVMGLGAERRAPLVSSYLAAGGGRGTGLELFVDFTPLVEQAEAALKQAVDGVLPDPTRLLGLEAGTWLHASADVFPGTRVDCRARLRLPPDTLAAQLADTFGPLPHTLPADLPRGVFGLWALHWDVKLFYSRVRAAYAAADRPEGFELVDGGIEAARGMVDVDPVVDVLNQLTGDVALYLVDDPGGEPVGPREVRGLRVLGFQLGLLDGDAFLTAFEKLIDTGGLANVLDHEEIAGADAYVAAEGYAFDGGLAFLPRAFTAAPSRRVLERALLALTRADDASLLDGSRMQAAIDESAGACFLACVEMTPLRRFLLPKLEGDLLLPPLEEGQAGRDPFDAQLISTVRRTRDGFEFRLHTR